MSFFIFLIFIILFIVAIPLLRIAAALINMKRRVANAFGGKEKPGKEPQRRKVYDKDVGEYVKFEEIAVDKSDDTPMEKVEYREESQVSDVEFEEIRD